LLLSHSGLHSKLMATLDTNHTRPSKGIKRKCEDNNNLLAVFQSLLAHVADDDEDEITMNDSSDNTLTLLSGNEPTKVTMCCYT